jgi:hypothetical protein
MHGTHPLVKRYCLASIIRGRQRREGKQAAAPVGDAANCSSIIIRDDLVPSQEMPAAINVRSPSALINVTRRRQRA